MSLRLGVYADFSYRFDGESLTAELPFGLFIEGLAPHCELLVVFGRLDPGVDRFPFELHAAKLVALPYYSSGAELGSVLRAVPASLQRFWRALDALDTVWILGPNPPQAQLFALLGVLRRRKVVLGVRQNLPELLRHRRPNAHLVVAAAYLLEWSFRLLARRLPVVVVGPDLAQRYRRATSQLSGYVSLLRAADLLPAGADRRRYDSDELVMLSVGRLDPEKNPLLLADVLHSAVRQDPRWRLVVCGDGTLASALTRRAAELGVSDRVQQLGFVPIGSRLWELYRSAHALVHVSMTEGAPQVILEAFAARLPVVATDVGGVASLVEGRGLLVRPQDPHAAATALARLAADQALRQRFVDRAQELAAEHTIEAECSRLAEFLAGGS